MKNQTLIFTFLLLTHFVKGQFSTFILVQDENIEISVKYKETVSFIDEDFITLSFINKTNQVIKLDSVYLTGRDTVARNNFGFNFHFDNEDYTNNRKSYLNKNWQKQNAVLEANTIIIKNTSSHFTDDDFHDFRDFYPKIQLYLLYSIDNQIYELKNESIFFLKTIKLKNIEEKEIVDFINKNIENGGIAKGGDTYRDLFTIKGNIWEKLDGNKFIDFLANPNVRQDYTATVYTKLISYYGSKRHIQMLKELFVKKIKENSTLIFTVPPHFYWDSTMIQPLLERYEKDTVTDDIFCYTSFFAEIDNIRYYNSCYQKIESPFVKEIYRITKSKSNLFFKNDKTKKDTLNHFKEWMLILTFTHSKEWIPYLKTLLKDTSTVFDHNQYEPSYRHFKTDWCYNRSKKNMMTDENSAVCGDAPRSIRDFAITTIYHLQDKNICSDIRFVVEKLKLLTSSDSYFGFNWELRNDEKYVEEYNRKQRQLYDYLIENVDKESVEN